MQTSQIPFYRGFFRNNKDLKLASRPSFLWKFFDKKFSIVMLRKLIKIKISFIIWYLMTT